MLSPTAASSKPQIAAVLADVDGTLVTRDKILTPRGMRMLVEPLDLQGPMAAFNGGIVVLPDMSIVDERAIPARVAPVVIQTLRAYGLYAWIYSGAEWYITDPHAAHAAREATMVQFEPTVVPAYDGFLERVVKIVGVSDDHDLVARCEAAVQHQFATHVSTARSQPHYLDVTHPTANKGVVVERLSSYHHIPLEQIATVGDQPNDVLMFNRSGMSIAMGNASDGVKRQATFVTASHEEEGFAKAIEKFVLPRAVPAPVLATA